MNCATLFHPHQLGVALPRGAEIGVHTLRQYITSKHETDKVILKIDYKNAFNSIRRDKVLEKVKQYVPSIYPMVWQAYSKPSKLFFNDEVLFSQEGVQQGDPLGPFLFSLGIMDLMKACSSEVNLWYLDDGTLGGNPETVQADLARIIAA